MPNKRNTSKFESQVLIKFSLTQSMKKISKTNTITLFILMYTIIYNSKYRDVQSEHSLLIQQITKDEARKHNNLEQTQKELEGLFGLTF